jgi:hypothetical protein
MSGSTARTEPREVLVVAGREGEHSLSLAGFRRLSPNRTLLLSFGKPGAARSASVALCVEVPGVDSCQILDPVEGLVV